MVLVPPPPPRFDEIESPWERTKRKVMAEPMIPLGCLFTCGAMGMAFRERMRFDSSKFNYWLRWRIMFQYGTIAMAVYYTWARFYKDKAKKPIVQDAFWKDKEASLDKTTLAELSTPQGGIASQLSAHPIDKISDESEPHGIAAWIYSWWAPKPDANEGVKNRLREGKQE